MAEESSSEDSPSGISGNRQKYVIGVLVLLVVVAGGFYIWQNPQVLQTPQNGGNGQSQQDDFEQYANANQDTGSTDVEEDAEIAVTINIDEFGTTPARAQIGTGEAVRWVNENSFPVYITFDRTSQEPTIQPGESLEMRFRGVTYYEVFNSNTDERVARGSISVG